MSAIGKFPVNLSVSESIPPVLEDELKLRNSQIRVIKAVCTGIVIFAGLLQAWIGAYFLDPDGVCYVDVGRAFVNHHWLEAFNSYWSPLYAWILGSALQISGWSARWELPIIHAVNFAIYLFAFWCFNKFLRTALALLRTENTSKDPQYLPEFGLWLVDNGIFLWSTLTQIPAWEVSPDLLVAATVYLVAEAILKIKSGASLGSFAKLGVILGLSYWCKAVMFPLGCMFLVIAWFASSAKQRNRYINFAVAVLLFALVSSPLVLVLSKKQGHFTFGDSGWLNYSSYVSPGGRVRNWQGQPAAAGIPIHATRKIFEKPDVFEFAQPIGGTYPPSYDPPYWNAGRQWTFHLRTQIAVAVQHLILYANLFLFSQVGILVGVFTLVFCSPIKGSIFKNWPLLAVSFCAFATYMLVHAENRFLGAYLALVWMAILLAIKLPAFTVRKKIIFYLMAAIAISCVVSTAGEMYRQWRDSEGYSALLHLEVAQDLNSAGVHPGAQIAVIGNGNFAYYAHFDRTKIVAEIMEENTTTFWTSTSERRNEVYSAFAKTGALALVAKPPLPLVPLDAGWIKLGSTPFYMRWLQKPQPTNSLSNE